MPRSRSRVERNDPPPRRKSCHACVKAKRRCDQRQPACIRCSQRGIACHYPARAARSEAPSTDPLPATPTALGSDFLSHVADVDDTVISLLDPVHETEALGQLWPSQKAPCLQHPELPWTSAEGLNESTQLAQPPSLALALDDREIFGSEAVDSNLFFDFTDSTPTGVDIALRTPLGVTAPKRMDLAALHTALETNFSYAMDRIKAAPATMLLENQTPWCHPLLYRENMPRVIQDAISACALHASKNTVNARVVLRCIDTKVDDLLASPSQPGPLDALARTQALLLYQTIRFFDGDIIARSSADATFGELESSIHSLHDHISWDATDPVESLTGGPDSLSLLPPSREFWKAWIFQESARRTFLVASFFVHIWKMLTGRPPARRCGDQELLRQCWTLSAHLWEAGDAVEFAAAWRDRKHYVVRRGAVRSTLRDAEAGDFESFGKMLLTSALGIDETKAWLASMGARL